MTESRQNEDSIDRRARAAYDMDMRDRAEAHKPWADLAEWQREAWRCEVDPDRDPRRIVELANGGAIAQAFRERWGS